MNPLFGIAMKRRGVCQYLQDNRRSNKYIFYIYNTAALHGEKQNKKSFRWTTNFMNVWRSSTHFSGKANWFFFLFQFGFLVVLWWIAFKYYAKFSFKWTLLKIPESILQRASALTAMMNKLSNTEHSHISKYSVSAGLTKRIMPKLAVRGGNDPSPSLILPSKSTCVGLDFELVFTPHSKIIFKWAVKYTSFWLTALKSEHVHLIALKGNHEKSTQIPRITKELPPSECIFFVLFKKQPWPLQHFI